MEIKFDAPPHIQKQTRP